MPGSQSEEYLEVLLPYLACPIDPTVPLTAVRDDAGRVVALRSPNGEYPLRDNVPCLIPGQGASTSRETALWQKHQDEMWQDYQNDEEGVFSPQNEVTDYLGEIVDQQGTGTFLDLGCGALPLPSYMAASRGHVQWIGIDPFFGDAPRQFPFAQAVGEYLPFRPAVEIERVAPGEDHFSSLPGP